MWYEETLDPSYTDLQCKRKEISGDILLLLTGVKGLDGEIYIYIYTTERGGLLPLCLGQTSIIQVAYQRVRRSTLFRPD